MQATKRLEYVADPNKFDTRTHIWDAQGKLVAKNPYRLFIVQGNQYFERPVNSGNLWTEGNQPAGRVECKFNDKGHIVSKEFDFTAPHKKWVAPLTGDSKLHYELEQERARTAELEAELAAIRGERAPKPAAKPAAKE